MSIVEQYIQIIREFYKYRKYNTAYQLDKMILLYIMKTKKPTPIVIANALSLAPQLVSTMINQLEKKSWVIREIDTTDRRKYNLILTKIGLENAKQFENQLYTETKGMLDYIGEKDVQHLMRIYKKIIAYHKGE